MLRLSAASSIVLFLILFTDTTVCSSQSFQGPHIEWGNVSNEELLMKSYPQDTSAAAVVLFDYGETKMNNELGLTFTRHKRIKIFSKSGYFWGTEVVSLYTWKSTQKMGRIKGCTYAFGPDGTITKTEMEDKDVFTEKADEKWTHFRFTLPALQSGCVIEIGYTVVMDDASYVPDWEFQTSIPTLWSEYRVTYPRTFAYSGVQKGYEKFFIDTTTVVTQYFYGRTSDFINASSAPCLQRRWVVRNGPAIRDEPFVAASTDYTQQVHLQLSEYAVPTGGKEQFLKTWTQFVEEMVKDKQVGGAVDVTGDISKVTERTIAGATTPEQKMRAIYDFVRSSIVWSGENKFWAEKDVDEVLETKKGTSAEICVVLLSMFRCAGLEAYPMILSTRENGKTYTLYPIMSQFNYMLALVKVGSGFMAVDATDPLRPPELLPTKVLNTGGLIIAEGEPRWATLLTDQQFDRRLSATLDVDESGEINGTLESVDNGYAALLGRKYLKDGRAIDLAKKIFDADRSSLVIDSVDVTGRDSLSQPLTVRGHVSSTSYVQASGDLMYLNPFIVGREFTNPFTRPKRDFPIDFNYPRTVRTKVTITLPPGFEVQGYIRNKKASVDGSDAVFSRTCFVDGRKITITTNLTVGKIEFPASAYQSLKDLYENVTAAESEHLVVQRTQPKHVGSRK